MQLIKCTKKLLDELQQKPPSKISQSNNLGSRHANILQIERRKCVLVTNELTLYALFIPCLTKTDFKAFHLVFGRNLLKNYLASRNLLVRFLQFFLTGSVLLLSGCAHFASQPMDVLSYVGHSTSHKNLFVFVRGLGGSNRSFAEEGMVEATWQRGIDFDMVAPNSHFAYYSERTLIERLRQDVILPAKNKGYTKIWLVGPSMGGLGSLLYVREYPEDIDGIYLISPFLGDDEIIDEINDQGGLGHWKPGDYSPDEDWQRMLWHWIKADVERQNTPPIYLGYGNDDMYGKAQRLLVTALPESHISRLDGGHDYETFKALWLKFLERDVYLKP